MFKVALNTTTLTPNIIYRIYMIIILTLIIDIGIDLSINMCSCLFSHWNIQQIQKFKTVSRNKLLSMINLWKLKHIKKNSWPKSKFVYICISDGYFIIRMVGSHYPVERGDLSVPVPSHDLGFQRHKLCRCPFLCSMLWRQR